jgi:Protein of unknown function (DUF3309)
MVSPSIPTLTAELERLMGIGTIPSWPHSRSWGYGPSGGIGLIVLLLMGRI